MSSCWWRVFTLTSVLVVATEAGFKRVTKTTEDDDADLCVDDDDAELYGQPQYPWQRWRLASRDAGVAGIARGGSGIGVRTEGVGRGGGATGSLKTFCRRKFDCA